MMEEVEDEDGIWNRREVRMLFEWDKRRRRRRTGSGTAERRASPCSLL